MAQHNPQSRMFLIVFLVATVICFAAAKAILSGAHDKSHPTADHGGGHKTEASDASHKESASPGEREHESMDEAESGGAPASNP